MPEELELLQSTVAINQYLSAEKTREIVSDLEHKKPFDCREQSQKLSILYGRYDKMLKLAPTSENLRIHLSCSPAIINNLIDDFGWSIQSRNIKDPDHPDWVHVTAKASLMGAAIFCTHHCKDCKVIGPDKLKEKVIENLKAGLALYE